MEIVMFCSSLKIASMGWNAVHSFLNAMGIFVPSIIFQIGVMMQTKGRALIQGMLPLVKRPFHQFILLHVFHPQLNPGKTPSRHLEKLKFGFSAI